MINLNNEKNKSAVIIGRVKRTDNLSRIKKEAAEIAFGAASQAPCLGSRLLSCPRMTMLWLLRFVCTPLRMTIPVLTFLLSLNLSESWAVTCNFTPDPNNEGKYSLEVKGDSGGNVFSGCDNGFPDGISGWSQVSSKITSATLDKNITSIGDEAFLGASSLTSITIPDSVESIGGHAFSGASSLESITIPDSVTSIGDWAFYGAGSLTSITISEGVTSIEASAFWGAGSLTSITIPDSVTSIGWSAFAFASSLTSITIPDSVTSIGSSVFYKTSSLTNIMCKGDETSCAATVNTLRARGYTGNISYPTDKTSCEGSDISLFVWDDINSKCRRRNKEECNSVAKYYYSDGQCKSMLGAKTTCKNADLLWNGSSCVKSCASGFVEWDKECLSEYPFAKKRWTPAEANEWLHDGNDNFVVITFKK